MPEKLNSARRTILRFGSSLIDCQNCQQAFRALCEQYTHSEIPRTKQMETLDSKLQLMGTDTIILIILEYLALWVTASKRQLCNNTKRPSTPTPGPALFFMTQTSLEANPPLHSVPCLSYCFSTRDLQKIASSALRVLEPPFIHDLQKRPEFSSPKWKLAQLASPMWARTKGPVSSSEP